MRQENERFLVRNDRGKITWERIWGKLEMERSWERRNAPCMWARNTKFWGKESELGRLLLLVSASEGHGKRATSQWNETFSDEENEDEQEDRCDDDVDSELEELCEAAAVGWEVIEVDDPREDVTQSALQPIAFCLWTWRMSFRPALFLPRHPHSLLLVWNPLADLCLRWLLIR